MYSALLVHSSAGGGVSRAAAGCRPSAHELAARCRASARERPLPPRALAPPTVGGPGVAGGVQVLARRVRLIDLRASRRAVGSSRLGSGRALHPGPQRTRCATCRRRRPPPTHSHLRLLLDGHRHLAALGVVPHVHPLGSAPLDALEHRAARQGEGGGGRCRPGRARQGERRDAAGARRGQAAGTLRSRRRGTQARGRAGRAGAAVLGCAAEGQAHQAVCRLSFSSSPEGLMEWNRTASPLRGFTARTCLRQPAWIGGRAGAGSEWLRWVGVGRCKQARAERGACQASAARRRRRAARTLRAQSLKVGPLSPPAGWPGGWAGVHAGGAALSAPSF